MYVFIKSIRNNKSVLYDCLPSTGLLSIVICFCICKNFNITIKLSLRNSIVTWIIVAAQYIIGASSWEES